MIVVDQFLTALLEEGQVLLGEIRGSKDWSLYGKRIGPIPGSVVSNGGRYIDVALCIDSNQEKVLGMVSHKMSINFQAIYLGQEAMENFVFPDEIITK